MLVADRYRLGSRLGRGGMGEVWHAVDEVLGRPVAVKLLLPSATTTTAVERFQREARAAARLNHPNVVAVYDFGVTDERPYLVLEPVAGASVARRLEEGPFELERAIEIVRDTAAGLAAAHGQGVVHRDVKPGNLLLTPDGTVKIADFGIAQFTGESASGLTTTGEIVGTSYYLAPERALGRPAGPASDVYSLGCVFYHLITGHPPFHGDAPAAVAYQHVDADPIPPAGLPSDVEAILLRMLAKDPAARPTAAEIAAWAPLADTVPLRRYDVSRRKAIAGITVTTIAAAAAVVAAFRDPGLSALTRADTRLGPTGSSGRALRDTSPTPTAMPTVRPTATTTPRPEPTATRTTTTAQKAITTPKPSVRSATTPTTGKRRKRPRKPRRGNDKR